jgi:hypothetical protein
MIVASRIGHAETDDDVIQEWRIGQLYSRAAKIVTRVKRQFVDARLQTIARD